MQDGHDPDAAGRTDPVRKIIHVDMDAFYASVEQRDDPSLRGRPVAVGGSRERGVVAAASYEARRHGVRSAMPSVTARRRCPDLVFVTPRFEVYREVSARIRAIFLEYTLLVEPLSLDEAYLDVTSNARGIPLARDVASEIRSRIREETGLTASAGVSYCKFLAKAASGYRKPDAMTVIPPQAGEGFVALMEVARFHGIGERTAGRMHALGIRTGADLRACTMEFLQGHFGKAGTYFHAIARGVDERPVTPDRVRKSIGAETTFPRDLRSLADILPELAILSDKVWLAARRHEAAGRTVTLKVRFDDFAQVTRSRTLTTPLRDLESFGNLASAMLRAMAPLPRGVRLVGVSLSGLDAGDDPQLALGL